MLYYAGSIKNIHWICVSSCWITWCFAYFQIIFRLTAYFQSNCTVSCLICNVSLPQQCERACLKQNGVYPGRVLSLIMRHTVAHHGISNLVLCIKTYIFSLKSPDQDEQQQSPFQRKYVCLFNSKRHHVHNMDRITFQELPVGPGCINVCVYLTSYLNS